MIDQFALHAVDALPRAWARAVDDRALDTWWVAGEHARVYAVARARADRGWTLAFYRTFDPDAERARAIAREILNVLQPIELAALLSLGNDRTLHAAILDAVEFRDTKALVAKVLNAEHDPERVPANELALHAFGCVARPDRTAQFSDIWGRVIDDREVDTILLAIRGSDIAVPEEHAERAERIAVLAGRSPATPFAADALAANLATAYAAAAALALRLLEPPSPPSEPPTERRRTSAFDTVRGVAANRGKLTNALRVIARIGEAGYTELATELLAALEAITGSLAGTDVFRAALALAQVPGRAHDAAKCLDDFAGPEELAAVAAGLARDGDLERAALYGEDALRRRVGALEDTSLVQLARVVGIDERVTGLVRAALADIPTTAAWPLERAAVAVSVARSPELEAQLAADPGDVATLRVYADFLTQRGDPRGELIALQHEHRVAEAALLLAQHAPHFLGELGDLGICLDGTNQPAFRWRDGFLQRVRLGYARAAAEQRGQADATLARSIAAVFAHPSGALVRELVLAANVDDRWDLAPAIAALASADRPALRALVLGDFSFHGAAAREHVSRGGMDYEISWARVPDLRALWPRVPNLRHLVILGSLEDDVLGELALPHLETLAIRSGGIAAANLRAVAASHLPNLQALELWTGSSDYGFSGDVADLAPILAGVHLPALRVLRLMNSELADALVEPLARSAILPRLAELSLAMGTLSDAGAALLHTHAAAWAHLERLELDDNYLSSGDNEATLESLAAEVWFGTEKDPGAGERFVSVGE